MFLLFAGADYYPEGGWEDFKGVYNSIEEAKSAVIINTKDNIFPFLVGIYQERCDWWHIVDMKTFKIIESNQE